MQMTEEERRKMEESYSRVHFLGEDDYYPAMETSVAVWMQEHVAEGYLESEDGLELHYYYAIPEHSKGVILMVHGFCEFFEKYLETAWYFWQAGFSFFFLEMRGHGYSDRLVEEIDLVHVDSFQDYVDDQKLFLDHVVIPAECARRSVEQGRLVTGSELKIFIFAHSMGGCISALMMENWPSLFAGAVLSSPMIAMNTRGVPRKTMDLIRMYALVSGKRYQLSMKQRRFPGIKEFEKSGDLSRARYDFQFDLRLENDAFKTWGGTFGWVGAALDASDLVLKGAVRVRTPILLCQAGLDRMVDNEAQERFAAAAKRVRILRFPESKHEIFSGTEQMREQYYREVFAFLDQHAGEDR